MTFLLEACGSDKNEKIASDEECSKARAMGCLRAHELAIDVIGNDTIKIEATLIDVRSREQKIRRAGYTNLADSYVEGFLAALDSVNPSLAAEIR